MAEPIPDDYRSVTPSITFNDTKKTLDFYKQAFGAKVLDTFPSMAGSVNDPFGYSCGHRQAAVFFLTFIIFIMTSSVGCAAPNKYSTEEQDKNRDKWSACEVSEECAVIQGECELTCVNKKFVAEAEPYYHLLGTMVSCAAPEDRGIPQPLCRNNRCECEYPGPTPDPVPLGVLGAGQDR